MHPVTTTAHEWQRHLTAGTISISDILTTHLTQIAQHNRSGVHLSALISVAPNSALRSRATTLDTERTNGHIRSPMHGIPIILKDIIPTAPDIGLPTTCGAYAFRDAYGRTNGPLVQRLLDAGMVILGKTNLNEYCRLQDVKSGWSALGGQTQSAYVAGGMIAGEAPVGHTTVSGSSSGSAAGVAAGFAPVSIGTETVGSLVVPANRSGLWALKVTNDEAPKDGILCLSKTLDSLGAMTKSVKDLRVVTEIILDKSLTVDNDAQRSKVRAGFLRPDVWRFPDALCPLDEGIRKDMDERWSKLIESLRSAGLDVVSDVDMSTNDIKYEDKGVVGLAVDVEFKANFAEYASGLTVSDVRTVPDLIAFNEAHPDLCLPEPFRDQKNLKRVSDTDIPHEYAEAAIVHARKESRARIDGTMAKYGVDLLICPGDGLLFLFAALAGYPIGSMPWTTIEYGEEKCRPEGLLVMGKAGSEAKMLAFMAEYQRIAPARPLPRLVMAS